MSRNNPKSLVMMISSMLIFGSIGIFRRYIPVSSPFLAFLRGILGGLFILVFMLITKRGGKERLIFNQIIYLLLTGAMIGINWILLFEAFNRTTVAVATLCYYMQPTVVILLSPLIFKEKLTFKKAACAVCAVCGMVLVSGVTEGAGGKNLCGILFGLGAAVFYSAVVIMNKLTAGINAYKKTAIQLFSAGIVTIPYLLLSNGFETTAFGASTLILLLTVCILHTGIAYVLYFGSMDGLGVQSVAILGYIDPVFAVILSALLLNEPLSVFGIIGAIMIIGSAIISELQISKR